MMFKKGDVVVSNSSKTVVRVLEDQTTACFYGEVLRAYSGSFFEGQKSRDFIASSFKLKQAESVQSKAFPTLKDGMIVKTKEPCLYLVVRDKVLTEGGYNDLAQYHHDGSFIGDSDFDIVKVWNGNHLYFTDIEEYVDMHPEDVIWEENKNAKAIVELEDQIYDLQEQLSVLKEKLTTLREEK